MLEVIIGKTSLMNALFLSKINYLLISRTPINYFFPELHKEFNFHFIYCCFCNIKYMKEFSITCLMWHMKMKQSLINLKCNIFCLIFVLSISQCILWKYEDYLIILCFVCRITTAIKHLHFYALLPRSRIEKNVLEWSYLWECVTTFREQYCDGNVNSNN